MSDDNSRQPLTLGPGDLARPPVKPLDYDRLHGLLMRHLDAHLPVLVDEAVTGAVEPIAATLQHKLREAITARLVEDREALIDDIILELRRQRGD